MNKVVYFILISLLAFTSCKEESINSVVVDTIPSPPTLDAPTDTSFNIDIQVTLKWNESIGAKSYTLQVSSSSSFTTLIYNKKDITTTTQQISQLDYSTVYYWRVSATNSAGTSDWSKVWSFTSTYKSPAFIPSLTHPGRGEVDESSDPTLYWNIVSNAKNYSVEVSTNSSFTSFVFNEDSLMETSMQLHGLDELTKYYWRVNATNEFGSMGWSETRYFITGTTPLPPILLSPSDGAINQLFSPKLTWNESTGTKYYYLQLAIDSSFSNLVFSQSVGQVTNWIAYGLKALTKYYWKVRASNNVGISNWSERWSFTTQGVCGGIETILYENKTYHTVIIGNQCWLKENLNVGTMIQSPVNMSDNGILEKYCWNNNALNCDTYGGLYQWSEAMKYSSTSGTQGICPEGWHIPTSSEFAILATAVGQSGNALKAVGQGTGNGAGTNTSGFSALLSGFRMYNGYFQGHGYYLWSSTIQTDVYSKSMFMYDDVNDISDGTSIQVYGYGIRCLKD
ncbi:MAG: hypothetical protein M0P61_15360 [Ignavibacteriaceae bacterium]|nr:hypothetical protein [Ignavibacteriaceae bacterium]